MLSACRSVGREVDSAEPDGSQPSMRRWLSIPLALFGLAALLTCPLLVPRAFAATITYIQSNYAVPTANQSSVTVPYTAAQNAGDLNIVVVGWGDATTQVASVADSKGNFYQLAIGPTRITGASAYSQSIYYASNIAGATAGTNAVVVTFSSAAPTIDVRVLEYSGLDPVAPLDVAVGAGGTNSTSNSGSVTTKNAMDLLVGANIVHTWTTAAGTGYTKRILTNPNGDLAEDRVVTATGSYSATASLGAAGPWVMQMAAFKAAGSGPPDTQPPTAPTNLGATEASVTQVNLTWTASTDNVAVSNYLVERCAGAGCSNFAQIATSAASSYNNTGLTASTSYSYRVRATDAAGNLSGYSNVATAVTADTQAPTAPAGLTSTAVSGTQVNLSWTASTDNVAVTNYLIESCSGTSCTNFAQIATTTGTTFPNTGLTSSTSYSYRVRATDAAGNLSGYSNTATASTPILDTQAPTVPSNLIATTTSATQINLTWTASTDNVGVTNYLVERCAGAGCTSFAQIGTPSAVTYSDTGLAANTSYSYRVRASDAAGNVSTYSNTASATTLAAPATPAFVQSNFAVPATSQTTVTIPYTAAQKAGDLNVVIVGWGSVTVPVASVADSSRNQYQLALGPTQLSGTPSQTFSQSIYYASNIAAAAAGANTVTVSFSGAAPTLDIRILEYSGIDTVNAVDLAAGNTGNSSSSTAAVTTKNSLDLLVAGNMVETTTTGAGAGYTRRILTSPNGDIAEDRVVTTAGANTAAAPLSPGGAWVMQVVAFRAAGSGGSGGDTTPPTAPASLLATAASTSQVNLAWTASTDNVGVTGYLLERCAGAGCANFAQIGTSTAIAYSDSGLAPSTSYSYRVRATDAANNLSAYSNIASATTQSIPDTQPPTAPRNLTGSAPSSSQISLSWTASTDNVGVTNYLIESCAGAGCVNFAQIATSSTTSYTNTGLTTSSSYSYRVRATDAAGNLSDYSNTATAVTQAADTQAPTAPSSLAATAASGSQVNLNWTASTDNVGVTAYFVERCQLASCSNFAQIATTTAATYSDSGLTGSTSYSYRVRASDAANNLSDYSNVASAVTLANPAVPAFVQGNYATPQTVQTSVTVPFTSAQGAGNLNVVAVGWIDDGSAQIASVTDTSGNTYVKAVGPQTVTNVVTQSIYYAKSIAAAPAGGNVVKVAFAPGALSPDVRILEYSGLDIANPLDGATGAIGSTATANSGTLVTGNATDLLFAANSVEMLTNGPGTGFTQRLLTSPDGNIAEDRSVTTAGAYTATAPMNVTGAWVMQLVAFRAAGSAQPIADTTPPTLNITAPAAGSTLSGTVSVTVSVSDTGTGLSGVQLVLDGTMVGAPVRSSPYTFSLATTKFANGVHSLGAYAWDLASNVNNAAPVSVTFSNANPPNPAVVGQWSGTVPMPIVSINLSLLPSGKVLMWDGEYLGTDARVWDPILSSATSYPSPSNVFCSGQEQMADGRILVAGGNVEDHIGTTAATIFDPSSNTWSLGSSMSFQRWYPTLTTLADGRFLVLSGENTCANCDVQTPEVYDPVANTWTQLTNAAFLFPYYPHVFVLPDGRVLVSSAGQANIVSQVLDVGAQTWTPIGGAAVDGGSAVMYLPGKVLKAGNSVDPQLPTTSSAATAYVLDATQATPMWRAVASMARARTYHNMTVLPDGSVLVTGGGANTAVADTANAVLSAEIWSPTTEKWTTMASMNAPRLYHSEALLLPDGRVMISGGGRFNNDTEPTYQFSAEYFSPAYLFKGPRPTITGAPSQLTYGQGFTLQTPDAARIASVSLVRFGTVTHTINMSQRFVPLTFTVGAGSLSVNAPANSNFAPPGNYMLFILDSSGIPSVAAIVHF